MPAKTKAILKIVPIKEPQLFIDNGIYCKGDLNIATPIGKMRSIVYLSKIKKEINKRIRLSNLSEEKQFKPQISQFKSLLKNKSIIPMIKFCSWVLDKNPRFKEVYLKSKMLLSSNIVEANQIVMRLVLFTGIPDYIKGRILKETYPALVKKIKKFKGIK